ncbi:MAG: hypothetical protein ACT4NT_03110 [Nitrososphaerota archaeon]
MKIKLDMSATWVFFVIIGVFFIIALPQSYSENADYLLVGTGYEISQNTVHDTTIQLALKIMNGQEVILQSGQILSGDGSHSIKNLDLSFLRNGKLFRINAVSNDDLTVKGMGKLITSNEDGSIYQITARTTKENTSQKIILLATLMQDKITQAQTESVHKQDVLLLVEHYDRVEWMSQYKFVVRTFDPQLNTNYEFYKVSGYLEGVQISAKITDPLGNVIKVSNGTTQKFGYYEDSIIIQDNARTGNYVLNVTTSGENFNTSTKELTFFVIPLSTTSDTP